MSVVLPRGATASSLLLALTLLTSLALAPHALGARASVHHPSLRNVLVDGQTIGVDIAFRGAEPCALASVGSGSRHSAMLMCGARFGTRSRLDTGGRAEVPEAFDVTDAGAWVIGHTDVARGGSPRPWLVRTTADLRPDPAFGRGGSANFDGLRVADSANITLGDVEVDAAGRVYVIGTARVGTGTSASYASFVARVTSAGELDATFGEGGVRRIEVVGAARVFANSMRLLADGTILVVGTAGTKRSGDYHPMAALLDANGAFVPSFGGDGIVEPSVGAKAGAASYFFQLPRQTSAFPMVVSASRNDGRGNVRPFVVQLRADGTLTPNWGGYASHKATTLRGSDPAQSQGMDVDVAPDGSILAAAETDAFGDYDSFVARFDPATGRPDTAWGASGIEPIDTQPGADDDEWIMSMAVAPSGAPWAIGGHSFGRTYRMHAFRTIARGPRAKARHGSVLVVNANGTARSCGTSARRACVVPRGTRVRIATVFAGWDTTGSALYRPTLHVWTRLKRGWGYREQRTTPRRYRQQTVTITALRLPRGTHEISAMRNGNASWSAGGANYVYVRVT